LMKKDINQRALWRRSQLTLEQMMNLRGRFKIFFCLIWLIRLISLQIRLNSISLGFRAVRLNWPLAVSRLSRLSLISVSVNLYLFWN
jgi:hypothetical protein